MLERIFKQIPALKNNWDEYKTYFIEKEFPAHSFLLREGEVSKNMFIIGKGCVRLWFNKDGKDITCQFFFENEAVSSMESFLYNTPGTFNIETLEPSSIFILSRGNMNKLMEEVPGFHEYMHKVKEERLLYYARMFFSRLQNTPEQRYKKLLEEYPHIVQRVPQHYIASFLGITPVSLSRIRHRL
jgi:CRP-like cAMP-binding protein